MKDKQNTKTTENDHPTENEKVEAFNLLTKNAFDFLETGITEFDDNTKYSIVHFSTAIEMFLKARLMHHDWKLIFSNKKKVDWKKLKEGNFHSVTIEEAKERIKAAEPKNELIDDAYINFSSLSNHRNKIIHFYHHELESSQEMKEKSYRSTVTPGTAFKPYSRSTGRKCSRILKKRFIQQTIS